MLSQNIQQKSLDLPDLAQDRDVILLILDQFLCKFVQVGINQPDQSVDSVASLAVQEICLLYTSPSPRDGATSRMPSSA